MYGTGPLEDELKHWIESYGPDIQEKINVKGYVENIENVYKNADLLLFLSAYESFGNVAVESILCGTPVVSFNIPSMKEIFKEYPEFLIENNEGFKESIFNKIRDIQELKRVATLASDNFSERFNTKIHVSKLGSIYNGFN